MTEPFVHKDRENTKKSAYRGVLHAFVHFNWSLESARSTKVHERYWLVHERHFVPLLR